MLTQKKSLLFNENDSTWLQKDSASPFEGWSSQSIVSNPNLQRTAKNDLNGLLYFYIRSIIERFCDQVQDSISKTKFILYCVDAATLPRFLPKATSFDRIEVSNIADEAYLGLPRTLATFAPLLKRRSINPHAALLTLFLNACEIADRMMGNDMNEVVMSARMKEVLRYMPLTSMDSTETMKSMAAIGLVRDYDQIFAWYMKMVGFEACSKNAGTRSQASKTSCLSLSLNIKYFLIVELLT